MRVYLDHNASSPLRPEVREAMIDVLDCAANASSIYQEGRKAKGIIERAREHVAALVGADAKGVTFTGGGSEANATVLQPRMSVKGKPVIIDTLLVSAVEHDSVLKAGQYRPDQTEFIPVDVNGVVDLEWIEARLKQLKQDDRTVLIAVMFANNETGVMQPVEAVGALASEYGAYYFCDAVQGAGKAPIDINKIGAHFLTLSAHKLGGPQGVGAIVRRSDAYAFHPLIRGGGQEAYGRAGTENIVAIHGFGVAAKSVSEANNLAKLADLRGKLEDGLKGVQIFGAAVDRIPNTTYIELPGIEAETMLISLDLQGFAVSSGSACSSGKVGPSYVLTAMGHSDESARSAIRISLGWNTKIDHIESFVKAFNQTISTLKPSITENQMQLDAV